MRYCTFEFVATIPSAAYLRERRIGYFWRETTTSSPAITKRDVSPMSSLKRRERSPSPARVARGASKRALIAEGSPARPDVLKASTRAECPLRAVHRTLAGARVGLPLIDRQAQEANIKDFVATRNRLGRGGCVYVCGAPGTGKSATVVSFLAALLVLGRWSYVTHCVHIIDESFGRAAGVVAL